MPKHAPTRMMNKKSRHVFVVVVPGETLSSIMVGGG
jgi:hypothetical protein